MKLNSALFISIILCFSMFTVMAYAVPDTTPPTLAEVTPVPTPTNDNTPDYTFSSDEAGAITYGGGCTSLTTAATAGSNTITFDTPLADGTYAACTIIVTDAASNPSTLLTITSFTVDTTPPVTTALAGAYSFGTWTNSDVTVTLSCDDGTGSGCLKIKYCTDDGSWVCSPFSPIVGIVYSGPVVISNESTTRIRFYSEDIAENEETIKSEVIKIDKTPPQLELYSPNSTQDTLTTNLLYAVDEINLDMVWYQYNGVNTTLLGNTTFTGIEGTNDLTLWANDTSGNINSTTFALTITLPAPPAPVVTGGGGGGCIYKWTCGNWSECQPGGTQTRACTLKNTCGSGYVSSETPPATTQSCTYTLTTTPAPTPTPTPPTEETTPTQPTAPAITGAITAGDAALYGGIVVIIIIIGGAVYLKFFRKKK